MCFVSSLVTGEVKDKDISWFSPNGEKLTPNQPRISVVRNDDFSSTLTIYNANIDDAGIYTCVITSEEEGDSEATVNVKIFRKSMARGACFGVGLSYGEAKGLPKRVGSGRLSKCSSFLP